MRSKEEIEAEENESGADLADEVFVFSDKYLEGYNDALRWVLGYASTSYSEERDEILK